MKQEIQKAIEKNLSAEVGKILKQRLEKAETDAAEVERLQKENSALIKTINSKDELISKHNKLNDRFNEVVAREDAVSEKEKNQEVQLLKIRLEESNKRADTIKDFTSGLVRNTLFRKSIFDSEISGQPVVDGMGNMHFPTPTTKTYTEEKIEE